MTARGGYFPVWPAAILHHRKFGDLTMPERGAWLTLRSLQELLEQTFDRRSAEREGVSSGLLDRLVEAHLVDALPDGLFTIHDIAENRPHRKPSDAPAAVAERVRRHREKESESALSAVTPIETPVTRYQNTSRVSLPECNGLDCSGVESPTGGLGGSGDDLMRVVDYLEQRTGRPFQFRLGSVVWSTLEADVRDFGPARVMAEMGKVEVDHPDIGQLVISAARALHPIQSVASVKQQTPEQRRRAEAHAAVAAELARGRAERGAAS
jgi:hypothetical protein